LNKLRRLPKTLRELAAVSRDDHLAQVTPAVTGYAF
jgi:hypothetical protein